MDSIVYYQAMGGNMNVQSEFTSDQQQHNESLRSKRGRPKGAKTATLAEVRQQAAEEKNQLKEELGNKIKDLQAELQDLQQLYDEETSRLMNELQLLKKRELNYQQALGQRLAEVASHLQETLLSWGTAELEEAQIEKRGRGRPRKTLK